MKPTEISAETLVTTPQPASPWRQYNWVLVTCIIFAASLALLLTLGYTNINQASSKSGGSLFLIPSLLLFFVTTTLIRVLPPTFILSNPLSAKVPVQTAKGLRPILGYALLYPFVLGVVGFLGLDYILIGKIGLLLIPTCVLFWLYGRNIRYNQSDSFRSTLWSWIGPGGIALFYLVVSNLPPFSIHGIQAIAVPNNVVAIVVLQGVLTLLNAGIPEELFYRVLLQTRLEHSLGRWNGIALTSLLFAVMHFPTRLVSWLGTTGTPALDAVLALAAVLTLQGSGGLMLGYLWSRYRNIWMNMLFHTALDLVPVIVVLVFQR